MSLTLGRWFSCTAASLVVALTTATATAAAPGDTRLVDALARQDLAAARALLKQGVDVNATSADRTTPLHWAAHWDDLDLIAALLKAGAKVNAVDDHGVSPLVLATQNLHVDAVNRLLKAGANTNLARSSGMTPIFDAIQAGHLELVKLFIGSGANVNVATTKTKLTPLMWAIGAGRPDIASLLIETHADARAVTADGFSALTFAARAGDVATARQLLQAGLPVNENGADRVHALPYAALSGQDDFALFLLEQGADPNARLSGVTALQAASGNATQFVADWQRARSGGVGLGTGVAPITGGISGMRGRGSAGHLPLIKALLARGARVNDPVSTSAMAQSYIGRPTKGAFENFSCGTGDFRGATALWLAAFAANDSRPPIADPAEAAAGGTAGPSGPAPTTEVIRTLLEAGANVDQPSDDGTTPLMVAAGLGHCTFNPNIDRGARSRSAEEAVTVLLDAKANINARNEADFTAMHGAAFRGLNEVIQILLDRGADVNARDYRGRTPFRIAEGSKQSFQFQAYANTAAFIKSLGADITLGVPGAVQERMRDIPATGPNAEQQH